MKEKHGIQDDYPLTKKQTLITSILLITLLSYSVFVLNIAYGQTYESNPVENIQAAPLSETMYIKAPENVYIGGTVIFSGQYIHDDKPASDVSIAIIEKSNNQVIGIDTTDSQGKYSVKWTPKSIGTYQIYARTPADLQDSATALSNVIFIDVTHPPPSYLLTLSASSLDASEKNKIKFYGSYTVDKTPLDNYPIKILDKDTGELVAQDITDSKGNFSVVWNVPPRDNPYQFYAISWDPIENLELDKSNLLKVTIKHVPKQTESDPELTPKPTPTPTPTPDLMLNPLVPDAVEGDVINITGYVTSYDFSGNRVFIKINDNISLIDKINAKGEFSARWSFDSVGYNKISAECLCDGKSLKSDMQTIHVKPKPVIIPEPRVPPTPPLEVNIVTDVSSGIAPLFVKFDSVVSGGEPPYKYEWDLAEGTKSSNSSLTTEYQQNGNYIVTLTVTDSSQISKRVSAMINVKEEKLIPPEILVLGQKSEGSPITFIADASHPEKITSYKWNFDDGVVDFGKEVTHTFQDDGLRGVELTVNSKNSAVSVKKMISVSNVAPTIINLETDKSQVTVNEVVKIYGEFEDPGIEDTYTVRWYVNDKLMTVLEENSFTVLSQIKEFKDPGDYSIALIVRDDDGGETRKETTLTVTHPPWLALGIGLGAAAGIAGVAAKTLLVSKSAVGKVDLLSNQQSDFSYRNHNENSVNESLIQTSNIEIEVNWGFER